MTLRQSDRRSRRRRLEYRHLQFHRLSPDAFGRVVEEMGAVMVDVTAAMGESWAYDDWSRRRGALRQGVNAYTVRDRGRLVGFVTYRVVELSGRPCLHLQSAYVRPEYQERGVGYTANARIVLRVFLRRPWSDYYMAADLLNPIVLAGWRLRLPRDTKLFPPIDGSVTAAGLSGAASDFVACHYPDVAFDPGSGVLSAKTLPRSNKMHLSGDREVDDHFSAHMDPCEGDTVLMLVDFDRSVIVRGLGELLRSVPRAVSRTLRPRHSSADLELTR